MYKDRVEGIRKQLGGTLREHWFRLFGDEAGMRAARSAQLSGDMQVRLGRLKDESERQLREFQRSHRDWDISKRLSQLLTPKGTT